METGLRRGQLVRMGCALGEVFQGLPVRGICARAYIPSPGRWFTMNRFDREYWDGAREMALMFYESIRGRKDVPVDLKRLAETALRETGERKNRDFREALGVVTVSPPTGPPE
jgi:hypothetical protein